LRDYATSEAPNLIDVIPLPSNGNNEDSAAASSLAAPTPEPPPLDPAFDDVYRALEPLCTIDDARVHEMIAAIRVTCPDATPPEMFHFIESKGIELRKRGTVRDMFKLLLKLVPPMLEGESFRTYRRRIASGEETSPPPPAEKSAADREWERKMASVRELRKGEPYEED
jgi:hypothetical protein